MADDVQFPEVIKLKNLFGFYTSNNFKINISNKIKKTYIQKQLNLLLKILMFLSHT